MKCTRPHLPHDLTPSWNEEYQRFKEIFPPSTAFPYIASLPGNHDIGISDEVSLEARKRFKRHLGEASTEFRAGDFTIISVDVLSLLAANKLVSNPPNMFLESIKTRDPSETRILLTHVPLYRPETAECGPLRESRHGILQA